MSEVQRPEPSPRPALIRARAALKACALAGGKLSNDTAAILVRDPQVSRHIGRLLHCEEWAESIQVRPDPSHSLQFNTLSGEFLVAVDMDKFLNEINVPDRKATSSMNRFNLS